MLAVGLLFWALGLLLGATLRPPLAGSLAQVAQPLPGYAFVRLLLVGWVEG
ncbi:MAG TPA: hypothetical protein G4O04_10030 [Anaerolineae bacterium]|nr:hypothetical protein [Anaerolineae bacterium]